MKKFALIILTLFAMSFMLGSAFAGEIKVINTPGERVDIEKYIVKGKTTIFDFFATWCGPCNDIAPYLEKLAKNKPDEYAIFKIDIKQWGSKVCKQYNIHSAPSFKIFDTNGVLKLEGKEAYKKVWQLVENQ